MAGILGLGVVQGVDTPYSFLYIVWTGKKERRGALESLRSPQLLPGTLFLLILRSLARGPLHGYAIARQIHESSKNGLQIEDGSLYPALNRMLVKGWVTAKWGISENNRRARFYSLTPEGRKQLEAEAEEFDKLVRAIQLVMRTA